jgi:hypothetical protein
LLWIGAEVDKGQNGDGGLVRSRWLSRVGNLPGCRSLPHDTHESKTFARQRLDQALATVADGGSRDVGAGRPCRVGDDAPAPDGVDEIVLTDHALTIADQVVEQVEHLRRDGDGTPLAMQLPLVGIEHAILEKITQSHRFPIVIKPVQDPL